MAGEFLEMIALPAIPMKYSRDCFRFAAGICLLALALPARAADSNTPPAASSTDPVQIETALIVKAHAAARAGGAADVDSLLASASPLPDCVAPSVLLARRTTAVCGWLQSDNEYGRAIKIARSSLGRLAAMKETNDADRAERLYWEAFLVGRILDQKAKAVTLLEAARKIAPEDERTAELELDFAKALAAFGR